MAAVFNTFEFIKSAKESGFTDEQAEFQATQFYNLINNHVATKHDMELLRKDVQTMKNEILMKLGGLMITGMSILGFILKH